MKTLDDAIDDLYAAFSDVPVPQHVDGCPCCIDDKDISQLLGSPLREIPPGDLAPYAASALLTVGDVTDYLYFLPRIVEVSITEPSWWPDIEVTAKAMRSTDFRSWPSTRRCALQAVLDKWVDHLIETNAYWELDGSLCACAILGLDVCPYLGKIELDPNAVLHYFEDNERCLKSGHLCNAFWELPNVGHDQIVDWFRSPKIRRIPTEAYGYVWPASSEQSGAPTPPLTRDLKS